MIASISKMFYFSPLFKIIHLITNISNFLSVFVVLNSLGQLDILDPIRYNEKVIQFLLKTFSALCLSKMKKIKEKNVGDLLQRVDLDPHSLIPTLGVHALCSVEPRRCKERHGAG
jgi:hypothetical protein